MLYNTNKIIENNVFPLDYRGMLVNSTGNYYNFINDPQYQFTSSRIINMGITEMDSYNQRLPEGTVRASFEVILS